MSKHTPGPWEAKYDDYGDEIWFGGFGYGTWTIGPGIYLGGDGKTQQGREQMEADAKLIAAAPDLLKALQDALATAEFEKHAPRPWHHDARDAIFKATK